MEINEIFKALNEKLDVLHHKVKQPYTDSQQIDAEIEDLKLKSEEIVEEWLSFESKLGQLLQQKMKQQGVTNQGAGEDDFNELGNQEKQLKELYQKWYQASTSAEKQGEPLNTLPSAVLTEDWKKGEALYDLLMFEHAVPYLERTLAEHPEFDTARLFLAHCYLAVNEMEKAKYQFTFLSETSISKDITHLALHGLACMSGALKQYDRSITYFEKIEMEAVRREWVPIFIANYALSLFHLRHFEECLIQWKKYYQLTENDWRAPFMIGKVFLQLGNEEAALSFWFEALQLEENVSLLKAMAKHFEHRSFHTMAAQSYERVLQNYATRNDVQSWFGLAWNLGLARRRTESAESFLKALSLFPNQLELQIAYTWMQLYWNEKESGLKSILKLKKLAPDHPLIHALAYLYEGKFGEVNDLLSAHLHTLQFPVS